MKKLFVILLCVAFVFTTFSCATNRERGAGAGAAAGALAGAAAFGSHSWEAAIIGAIGGAIIGGMIGDSIDAKEEREAKIQAAQSQKQVIYYTDDQRSKVESTPLVHNQQTECTKVRTVVTENGKVVKDVIEEVCRGTKTTQTY